MKISNPIMVGHTFTVFFEDVFAKYAEIFNELGVTLIWEIQGAR